MNTTILADELAQLNTQIEQARQRHGALEGELRVVEAELETFSVDRQRFDALRDVCTALDKLGELKADGLFWEGIAETEAAAGHLEQARERVVRFDGEIGGVLEKQAVLRKEVDRCLDELDILDEEVRDAYAREERRQEEYLVEREISDLPNHSMAMPWNRDSESERRFRRSLSVAFLFYVVFGSAILLWKLPPPARPVVAVVPERLVSMLRKEPPRPEPKPKEEKKPQKDQEKTSEKPKEEQPKPADTETQVARRKAESTGVLAFKDAFKDLMEETPQTRLGAEARLTNQPTAAAGQARASRSLIALPAGASGGSGGISNSSVSRNIGSGSGNGNGISGVGFSRVQSSVAGLAQESRPLSSGPGPSRTDEEIQIVFDRYKAALYRLYNTELRKDPTLRGKMILKITIEPGGEVSSCTVQSNDLASKELVSQVVDRVKKFNFGPKEKVSRITILYPIDFLPAV